MNGLCSLVEREDAVNERQDIHLPGPQRLNSPFQAGSGAALCNYNYISQAIGLGVRYKTPVGPVRFDFGYNLNPTVFPNFCMKTKSTAGKILHPTCPATLTYFGTKQASPFNVYFSIGQTF